MENLPKVGQKILEYSSRSADSVKIACVKFRSKNFEIIGLKSNFWKIKKVENKHKYSTKTYALMYKTR